MVGQNRALREEQEGRRQEDADFHASISFVLIDRGDVINFRKVTIGFVKVDAITNDKDIIDLFPEVVSLDLHFSPCLLIQEERISLRNGDSRRRVDPSETGAFGRYR